MDMENNSMPCNGKVSWLARGLLLLGMMVAAPLQAQTYSGEDTTANESEAPSNGRGRMAIDPYIEFNNIAAWQMSPVSDVVT